LSLRLRRFRAAYARAGSYMACGTLEFKAAGGAAPLQHCRSPRIEYSRGPVQGEAGDGVSAVPPC
jgi:hypothetical protein